MDREKRESEAKSMEAEATSTDNGLFANAKNGEDVLKKLQAE